MSNRNIFHRIWHTMWVGTASFVTTLLIIAALAIVFISRAHADSGVDNTYLGWLHADGITYDTTATALALGQGICEGLNHFSVQQIHDKLVNNLHNLTEPQVTVLMFDAVDAYCPADDPHSKGPHAA